MIILATAIRPDSSAGGYRAKALIRFRAEDRAGPPQPASVQQHKFFIRNPDLLTRVVADPAVAQTETIGGWADPVAELERRLAVEEVAPGVLEVALAGNSPEDLKAILDDLVKRFVADANASDNKARDDRLASLEKVRTSVQYEIDLQDKAIELLARTNGGTAPAFLHQRQMQIEAQLAQITSDRIRLEAQIAALKASTANLKPGAVEVARSVDADPRVAPLLAQHGTAVVTLEREKAGAADPATVKELQTRVALTEKALAAVRDTARRDVEAFLRAAEARRVGCEITDRERDLRAARTARDEFRREGDAIKKELESSAGRAAAIKAMRSTVAPQREVLAKIQAELIETRLRGDRPRVSPFGVATAAPVGHPSRQPRGLLFTGAAFAGGFVLVTGLQLTGLVFGVLRRLA